MSWLAKGSKSPDYVNNLSSSPNRCADGPLEKWAVWNGRKALPYRAAMAQKQSYYLTLVDERPTFLCMAGYIETFAPPGVAMNEVFMIDFSDKFAWSQFFLQREWWMVIIYPNLQYRIHWTIQFIKEIDQCEATDGKRKRNDQVSVTTNNSCSTERNIVTAIVTKLHNNTSSSRSWRLTIQRSHNHIFPWVDVIESRRASIYRETLLCEETFFTKPITQIELQATKKIAKKK